MIYFFLEGILHHPRKGEGVYVTACRKNIGQEAVGIALVIVRYTLPEI
ncbi:MAG: hypothetical protein ACKVJF_05920 [Flavobacteriales bacterium]